MNGNICELTVVRHGQTAENQSGILQGQMDCQLDDLGKVQALAVAERLRNRHFDAVFASDLGRAMVTAQTILQYHPELTITPAPELREWHLGDLQGRSFEELRSLYSHILNAFKVEGPIPDIPGGENADVFYRRVCSFMEKTASEHPGKRLLFVTHGGVMQQMFKYVAGPVSCNNIKPLCGNTSISIFQKRPAGWQLISWNDTAHLEKLTQHDTLTF